MSIWESSKTIFFTERDFIVFGMENVMKVILKKDKSMAGELIITEMEVFTMVLGSTIQSMVRANSMKPLATRVMRAFLLKEKSKDLDDI